MNKWKQTDRELAIGCLWFIGMVVASLLMSLMLY